MDKSIRVQVLGREYALRVREEDEAVTRNIAAYVDARMRAFKQTHPDQPEITTAVITALAIAEELYAAWEAQHDAVEELDEALSLLDQQLDEALSTATVARDERPPEEAPDGEPSR